MGRSSIRRAKLTFFRGGGGNETLTPMATGASVKVILPEYFTRQQVIIDFYVSAKGGQSIYQEEPFHSQTREINYNGYMTQIHDHHASPC